MIKYLFFFLGLFATIYSEEFDSENLDEINDPTPSRKLPDMDSFWTNGIFFQSKDGNFQMRIGGRILFDLDYFKNQSDFKKDVGNFNDGSEFRYARIFISGVANKDYFFKWEYDFSQGTVALKDAFVGMKNVPYIGNIRVGHYYEPFSLENLASPNEITFLEYSLPAATFSHVRNDGIEIFSTAFDQRMTWDTGVFLDANNYGLATTSEGSWATRITGLPYYKNEGRELFHLGASCYYRFVQRHLQYRSRPEAHLAPFFLDTGNMRTKRNVAIDGEVALVYGPFSMQGEYISSFVKLKNGPTVNFNGYYALMSIFLTGENRAYDKVSGYFVKVYPNRDFSFYQKGAGAWEIALRYSYLDLTDKTIPGGEMQDITLGVNWYLTPAFKIMGNYIRSFLIGSGHSDIFLMRFKVDY